MFEIAHQQVAAGPRLQVLLGDVLGPVLEQRSQRRSVGVEHRIDPRDVEPDTQPRGDVDGVLHALGARVRRGHREGADRVGAERVGRQHRDEGRVDAAGEAEDDVVEPVLPHVVAQTEDEGAVDRLGRFRPDRVVLGARRVVVHVDDQQVLVEERRPARDLPVRSHHDRATVEDELVLSPHRVHVRDPPAELAGPIPEDAEPLLELAPVVRRPVDVGHQRNAPVLGEGPPRMPGVLAHRQSHRDAAHRDLLGPLAGHEVPLLVEDPEVRQHDLVVAGADLAAGEEPGRVVQPSLGPVHEPGDHGTGIGGLRGELVERVEVVTDELGAEHEILGRVAGDRQLREAHELDAGGRCLRRRGGHLLNVAGEVADGEVQLAECDARHDISVARGAGRSGPGGC